MINDKTHTTMKKSVHTLFLEVVEEQQPDFDNPTDIQMLFVMNSILDRIDFTGYTQERIERKMDVVEKFVRMMFTQKSSWSQSLKKLVK